MDTFMIMLKNVLIFVLLAVPGYLLVKARNQLGRRDHLLFSVAHDARRRCAHRLQPLKRALRAVFLQDPQKSVDQNDRQHGKRLSELVHPRADDRRADQNEHHIVFELCGDDRPKLWALLLRQFVAAVFLKPPCGLGR